MIRRCFLFDRKLLADLSRIAWETLKEYMSATDNSMPGCVYSIQTFADFLCFNPHYHIIISDGTVARNRVKGQGEARIKSLGCTEALAL